jgi:hypothetical protein
MRHNSRDRLSMLKTLAAAALTALIVIVLAGRPAMAAQHIYSYDSVTPITAKMTENGLSFIFDKTVLGVRVRRILETNDIGAAELRPASESALGPGGLRALLEPGASERDLYEITDQADGPALRKALCRGSDHVWLAFGRLKVGRDLRIRALGDDPQTGKTRLCETLDYSFHGEWLPPTPILPQPDRTDRFNDAPNRLPY